MTKHRLITPLCLLGAVICYFAGLVVGAMALIAAGMLLESLFWFRLFRRPRRPR